VHRQHAREHPGTSSAAAIARAEGNRAWGRASWPARRRSQPADPGRARQRARLPVDRGAIATGAPWRTVWCRPPAPVEHTPASRGRSGRGRRRRAARACRYAGVPMRGLGCGSASRLVRS
jgi:hypothetical protein